jgi:SAM-dependent methyltransferase
MNPFRLLPKPLKRRMFRYTPAGFSDVSSCAAFYDVRHTVFAEDDMMILEYSGPQAQRRLFDRATTLFPPQGRILDLGCGLGHLLAYLDENGLPYEDYLGIDVSERMVEKAKDRLGERFEPRDILKRPLDPRSFDTGYLLSVLGYPIGKDPMKTMMEIIARSFDACRVGIVFSHLAAGRKKGLKFTTVPKQLAARCEAELRARARIDDDGVDFTYLLALWH